MLTILSLLVTISLVNIDRNIGSWSADDKIYLSSKQVPPPAPLIFIVGVMNGPFDLDPQYAWDRRRRHAKRKQERKEREEQVDRFFTLH